MDSEDELAAMTGEELPSTVEEENPPTAEINHQAEALTEQPTIVDSLTTVNSKGSEKIQPQNPLDLPEVNFLLLHHH